jgi:hypothetical protein
MPRTRPVRPAHLVFLALALLAVLAPRPAAGDETRLAVRVISKGAKFIGSSMGGVRITVADAADGSVLASGVTAGSTGDTARIMRQEHGRRGVLSTPGSAAFTATLDLERPTRLRVTAYGPLSQRQAATEASVTLWALPGKHLDGDDGVLLELPGFAVDVEAPSSHSRLSGLPHEVEVRANVTMMCGCPLEPGGLWDSDRLEIRARVERDGAPYTEVPLAYAGTASAFAGSFTADAAGTYLVTVYAYDPDNGNTGVDFTSVSLGE